MAFEPRLGDAYTSGDSITGKRDKTVAEGEAKAVVSYSSLSAANAVLGTAGQIFYAKVEKNFYGIKAEGNSTVAVALS